MEAASVSKVFNNFYIWHFVTTLACFYREVYTGSISKKGQFMRIVEIFCLVYFIGTILMALEVVSLVLVREHSDDITAQSDPIDYLEMKQLRKLTGIKKSTLFLADKCSR